MKQPLAITFLIWSISFSLLAQSSEPLNSLERAHLYRIVEKTPVLKGNLDQYIAFDKTPFARLKDGFTYYDYDSIEYAIIKQPELLTIDWKGIATLPPGLVAEVSTVLTYYQLNKTLNQCIYNDADHEAYHYFRKELLPIFPEKLSNKKTTQLLNVIVHPNLPFKKKAEALSSDFKLDTRLQRRIMDHWNKLLNKYITTQSQAYFVRLCPNHNYYQTILLAAGEGSGSAGLLHEMQAHPNGSDEYWYHKGIGLFTYEPSIRRGQLSPAEFTTTTLAPIDDELAPAIHMAVWGLDSRQQATVVITANNKSYRIQTDGHNQMLYMDSTGSQGSFAQRIDELKSKKIDPVHNSLQADNSLVEKLEKEYLIKESMEAKLRQWEAEVDSLNKATPLPEAATNHRKTLIESQLTALTAKEERIHALEQKLTAQMKSLEAENKKIAALEARLGPNPQPYSLKNGVYYFDDGAYFDPSHQDLILPQQALQEPIRISLLAGWYNLIGTRQDEVQLLVNTTSIKPLDLPNKPTEIQPDTLIAHVYFTPDNYTSLIDSTLHAYLEKLTLDSLDILVDIKVKPLRLRSDSPKRYTDFQRELILPLTTLGEQRTAEVTLIHHSKHLSITIIASTDPVPTRLSMLSPTTRKALGITEASVSNNSYLALLRALNVLNQLDIPINPTEIKLPGFINENQLKVLWEVEE